MAAGAVEAGAVEVGAVEAAVLTGLPEVLSAHHRPQVSVRF